MASTETTQPQPTEGAGDDVWTVQRFLEWTTAYFKKQGCDSPRLDTEVLLAHVRGCQRIQLYVQYHERLTDDQRGKLRELVKRRAKFEPVAYLVGQKEFFSLTFRVTSAVLIPRPETETLVADLIAQARKLPAPRILDVGTGSGCIALAAAKHLKTAAVTAIDLSAPAIDVARANAANLKLTDRVAFLQGDLFAPLSADAEFDFIASNPPYVAEGEMAALPADIRLHEPSSALAAGADGLAVIRRLLAEAPARLAAGGRLLFEFSPEQSAAVRRLAEEAGCYADIAILKDAAGQDRVLRAARNEARR